MPTIGTFVTGLPDNVFRYEYQVASFTVAAGATGGTYELPGSRMSVPISSVTNVAPVDATYDRLIGSITYAVSAKCTTASTDQYTLEHEISLNGGSTWTGFTAIAVFPGAGAANGKSASKIAGAVELIDKTAAVTNPLLMRATVVDATDPTTDIFTITGVRVTVIGIVL